MKNNIFNYATGELSQDAFICWCANWFNDDSRPRLQEMSVELMKQFADVDEIHSVRIFRQFSQDVMIEAQKNALKIDVLILVNDAVAVIVEDKTDTSEHDNQIQRYADGIRYLAQNAEKGDQFYGIQKIRTVFLKTGFLYDEDKCVKADVVISGEDFLGILRRYAGNSELLDSYIEKLESDLQWYVDFGNYEGTEDSFWDWNIANHRIAQYRLMRDIFPESMWTDRNSWRYRVYHGTNFGGMPWTQMQIGNKHYAGSRDAYSVFWRIDTDNKGPYLALRLYENFDKQNPAQKDRHRNLYETMSNIMKGIVEEGNFFQWREVYPGYRGNYKESSIIHIHLREKLMTWPKEKAEFIESIRQITHDFLGKMEEIP